MRFCGRRTKRPRRRQLFHLPRHQLSVAQLLSLPSRSSLHSVSLRRPRSIRLNPLSTAPVLSPQLFDAQSPTQRTSALIHPLIHLDSPPPVVRVRTTHSAFPLLNQATSLLRASNAKPLTRSISARFRGFGPKGARVKLRLRHLPLPVLFTDRRRGVSGTPYSLVMRSGSSTTGESSSEPRMFLLTVFAGPTSGDSSNTAQVVINAAFVRKPKLNRLTSVLPLLARLAKSIGIIVARRVVLDHRWKIYPRFSV